MFRTFEFAAMPHNPTYRPSRTRSSPQRYGEVSEGAQQGVRNQNKRVPANKVNDHQQPAKKTKTKSSKKNNQVTKPDDDQGDEDAKKTTTKSSKKNKKPTKAADDQGNEDAAKQETQADTFEDKDNFKDREAAKKTSKDDEPEDPEPAKKTKKKSIKTKKKANKSALVSAAATGKGEDDSEDREVAKKTKKKKSKKTKKQPTPTAIVPEAAKKKKRNQRKKSNVEKYDKPRKGDKGDKRSHYQFGGEMFDKCGYLVEENEELHAWSGANVQKKGFDYRRNIKHPCRRIKLYHQTQHVSKTYLAFDPPVIDGYLCYRCGTVLQLSTYEKHPKSCPYVKVMKEVNVFKTVALPDTMVDMSGPGKSDDSSDSSSRSKKSDESSDESDGHENSDSSESESEKEDDTPAESESDSDNGSPVSPKQNNIAKKKRIGQKPSRRASKTKQQG